MLVYSDEDVRVAWPGAPGAKRGDPDQVPPPVPKVALERAAAVPHAGSGDGAGVRPGADVAAGDLHPVPQPVHPAAVGVGLDAERHLVQPVLQPALLCGLAPASRHAPQSHKVVLRELGRRRKADRGEVREGAGELQ